MALEQSIGEKLFVMLAMARAIFWFLLIEAQKGERKNMTRSFNKKKWQKFFKKWKEIWRDPEISVYVKAVIFDVFLYRSDNQGWCISERKFSNDLGISKQSASKAIDQAIKKGFLLSSKNEERKRRKLRLSGSLRSPVWRSVEPSNWGIETPNKYQSKYQKNNNFNKYKEIDKNGKILSKKEFREKIRAIRSSYSFLGKQL
jgi:hypothetical protein